MSELIGKTVKSRQEYWYEVHEATGAEHELHLIPVDCVPAQYVSAEELAERMADGWELVYDGVTGVLEDEHPEQLGPRSSQDPGAEDAQTWTDGGQR